MTLIGPSQPGRMESVGRAEGATRIWVAGEGSGAASMPKGTAIGLHRHGGDEIFHILSGTVRIHLDGRNVDVSGGHYLVVPPYTEHGFKVLTDDARMEIIGEIEMGEWVTVLDSDGSRRQVEVRSTFLPWHRRPLEGEVFDLDEFLTMQQSTTHLLDDDPQQ
jgi:mannose-6-phosphate isomerase-like protein (cupin superfamily)